jgi:Xaa-Pro aminopeptidase
LIGTQHYNIREGKMAFGKYRDGVRLEENIRVTKDGYERLSLWPIEELMECWLPYK